VEQDLLAGHSVNSHAASAKSSAKSGGRTRAQLRPASLAEAISFADSENLWGERVSRPWLALLCSSSLAPHRSLLNPGHLRPLRNKPGEMSTFEQPCRLPSQ
jgi:hypothetical protein